MNNRISLVFSVAVFFCFIGHTQNLNVETLLNLNASGGVTLGPDGNIYVSDFGPALGQASVNTKVFKIEYGTWNVSEYATGFAGASGSRFDSQGNFYQSNPSGGRVGKRTPNGNVIHNWVTGMSSPIGITNDDDDNLYVCNCGNNTIRKITPGGISTTFATSFLFNCPNGITIDPDQNLYVCNFSDGRILKVTPDGSVSSFATLPALTSVGNGHLTYANGFLFVATIGTGQIFKLTLSGQLELIAGVQNGFSNDDGPALQATFSKPNGLAASRTGDTLFVNCSTPTWLTNGNALHPGLVRMITGVCSLPDVQCPLLTSIGEVTNRSENEYARLMTPAPNPSNEHTSISYEVYRSPQTIRLKLVDKSQKILMELFEGRQFPGHHEFEIRTNELATGMYHVVLESDNFTLTRKLLVVR